MAKIDLVSSEWTDLVFQGRNQAYGAYVLRKGTSKRNLWSIILLFLLAVLLFVGLAINHAIEANKHVANTQEVNLSMIENAKKKAEVKKKEPVVVEQKKEVVQVKSSIKFTAPVIKKDEDVKPEEEMKTQEELTKTNTAIGAFDVKGNTDKGEVLKAEQEIAQPEPPKHEEENKVFDVVEEQPSFPGGPAALQRWLRDNMKYPVVAAENGIEGRVIVQFVVGKDGSISGVKVVRPVDQSLDKEAVRVVSSMPRWTPGRQNGSSVNVRYTLPVTFKLQ